MPAHALDHASTLQIAILALIQGAAELLPVSSSAHVITAERLMGLDPGSPEMTFLLVMLHTGTMFAVLGYFRHRWAALLKHPELGGLKGVVQRVLIATGLTGVIGFGLKTILERGLLAGSGGEQGEITELFRSMPAIACALTCVGTLMIVAGRRELSHHQSALAPRGRGLSLSNAAWIGAIQGLCLPFRGFSRSGATISVGLLLSIPRALTEEFSFLLAIVLTPPVIAREAKRLWKATHAAGLTLDTSIFLPGVLGMCLSAISGFFALRLLSRWIDSGRWSWFGVYCYFAAAVVLLVHFNTPSF